MFNLLYSWTSIAADLLKADINAVEIASSSLGTYRVEAIQVSLCALMAVAVGVRVGRVWRSSQGSTAAFGRPIAPVRDMFVVLLGGIAFSAVMQTSATMAPALRQPLDAFAAVEWVCLFVFTATVLASGRGYGLLFAVTVFEIASGLGGFFAGFKEPLFVMMAGVAYSKVQGRAATLIMLSMVGGVTIALLGVTWSSIKPEYRWWVSDGVYDQVIRQTIADRLVWLADRVMVGVDLAQGLRNLLDRIGYTEIYALVLSRIDSSPRDLNLWGNAVWHVITPRAFFPDKGVLDDSTLTSMLTGWQISPNTSISVGLVAQAHVQFGTPLLFFPMAVVGVLIGLSARYFETRNAPPIVCHGFAMACVLPAFNYQVNIEKALGGFVVTFIALAIAIKVLYPPVQRWLVARARPESA
jgi:hypothetical protein